MTLVTSDAYVVGALVLAHSLRKVNSTRQLICMVTSYLATDSIIALREVCQVRFVTPLDSGDKVNLRLLGRPELGPTFTKLQLWTMTDLSKVVFLDADMLVLQNIDDLFERDEFSAAPDVGWPDCFNSGLFVAKPNLETYNALLQFARNEGSFDGGDQGLLNAFFNGWATGPSSHRIPFVYNLTFNACYSYLPAFARNHDAVRAVHFIGSAKPWHFPRFSDGQAAPRQDSPNVHLEYVQAWWKLHDEFVKPKANSANPPSFMALYSGSGYNPYVGGAISGGGNSTSHDLNQAHSANSTDFANYRIKWTADVETFFQKRQLAKTPSRKLVHASDSEDDRHYDPEQRLPIPKPSSSSGLSR